MRVKVSGISRIVRERKTRSNQRVICGNIKKKEGEKEGNIKKKYVLTGGIFYGSLLQYTFLREIKDTMMIHSCGAEQIPYMKTYVNLPVSLLMTFVYGKAVDKFGFTNTYRIIYTVLTIVFVGLSFMYMNEEGVGQGVNWIVNIARYPITNMLYVLSTIWGSFVISLMFWTLANRYHSEKEAKKVYPIFGLVSNTSVICGSVILRVMSQYLEWKRMIVIVGCVTAVIYMWVMKCYEEVIKNKVINGEVKKNKKEKEVRIEGTSKEKGFVISMIVIIVCYAMVTSNFEVLWKAYIKEYFTTAEEIMRFKGNVSLAKGVMTVLCMGISYVKLESMSVKSALLVTPCVMIASAGSFFGGIYLTSDIGVPVMIGAIFASISKAVKYAVFDPTKEVLYINATENVRTKGKALIDTVSSPLGKGGTSIIQQAIIASCGGITEGVDWIMIVVIVMLIKWIIAVNVISKTDNKEY